MSHQEIYQAVLDSMTAAENLEVNGGDDVDELTPTASEPPPTRGDVLKAIATTTQYIEHLNSPLARELEGLLGQFNREVRLKQTRAMKGTLITDFFQRS